MKRCKEGKKYGTSVITQSLVLGASLFLVSGSYAQTEKPEDVLEQYKKLFTEQQKEFEKQRQIILEQGREIEQLKARLDALSPGKPDEAKAASRPSTQPAVSEAPPRPADRVANNQPAEQPPVQVPAGPVGQAPPQSKEEPRPPEMPRLSETVGGVLTRKGKIVLEPTLEYAFSSNNRVFLDAFTFLPAIAVGLIDIRQVDQHNLMASVGGRYGVTDRFEVEVRVPYRFRFDEQRSRPVSIGAGIDETFNASGNNIGDIEFAGRYQLNSGRGGWPILVGNLLATIPTGKSPFDVKFEQAQGVPGAVYPTEVPTGVGFFSVQPSVTALYSTDPAVFFANLSYFYNAATKENIGKVDPGDAVGLTFGMGFAINERSSFNLGYSHRHAFNSTLERPAFGRDKIKGSQLDIGQLLLGYSFRYNHRTTYNLSLAVGTTDDAQDVRINFRTPITF